MNETHVYLVPMDPLGKMIKTTYQSGQFVCDPVQSVTVISGARIEDAQGSIVFNVDFDPKTLKPGDTLKVGFDLGGPGLKVDSVDVEAFDAEVKKAAVVVTEWNKKFNEG